MVSLISNSESMKFFNEYLLWFLFQLANWEERLFSFSNAKAEKNSWKKIVKQIGENLRCICYSRYSEIDIVFFVYSTKAVKSRGPILRVTSSETRSGFASAKFEYSLLIGQCRSQRWSRDTFLIKLRLYTWESISEYISQNKQKKYCSLEFEI